MVIAGEISGDHHAALVLKDLQTRMPDLELWGIGGDEMAAIGVRIELHAREMAVMGLGEVLRRYSFFRRVFHHMLHLAETHRPDAVLLVDYPGFNLRFAAQMKKLGIRVLYYISPQVWAWKKGRRHTMARVIDRLMVIFPFEVDVFRGLPLKVDYVGHPLLPKADAYLATPPYSLPWPGPRRIALLPGSRRQEIERILPVMLDAAFLVQQKTPNCGFLIAAASEQIADLIRLKTHSHPLGKSVDIRIGETYEILRQAEAAMVASGTATIDTALLRCPMAIIYITGFLTYQVGRLIVDLTHIGMANIIANQEVCPEFVQAKATPTSIANYISTLLQNAHAREQAIIQLEIVRKQLGLLKDTPSASSIIQHELLQLPPHP